MRYALEGGVQRRGNRLRIKVQLIDAETGHASLGRAIRQARGPSLHMQDEIVAQLANQTAVRFGDAKPPAPRTGVIVPLVEKTATVGRAAMVALAGQGRGYFALSG